MSDGVTTSSPHEIGGYTIVEPLREGETFLAEAPGGRKIVLKVLPADCLLEDELHPAIHDRLSHVRELAERNIANLHGVERDGTWTYLVWDYVDGQPIDVLQKSAVPYRDWLRIARDLVLTIESLHAGGIVHGALKPTNVIVDRDEARVRVTHVSPLLHNDPQKDADAIVQMLLSAMDGKKDRESPLGVALARAKEQRASLRQLSSLLATVPEPGQAVTKRDEFRPPKPPPGIARRAILGALVLLIFGAVSVFVAKWYINRENDPYRILGTRGPAATQPSKSIKPPTTAPSAAR